MQEYLKFPRRLTRGICNMTFPQGLGFGLSGNAAAREASVDAPSHCSVGGVMVGSVVARRPSDGMWLSSVLHTCSLELISPGEEQL